MVGDVNILAVDDDSLNLEMMTFMLSETDCNLITATNGREALDILAGNPHVDAILLDLEMPEMDGYAVKIMEDGCGTFFDPDLLALFLGHIDSFVTVKEQLAELTTA